MKLKVIIIFSRIIAYSKLLSGLPIVQEKPSWPFSKLLSYKNHSRQVERTTERALQNSQPLTLLVLSWFFLQLPSTFLLCFKECFHNIQNKIQVELSKWNSSILKYQQMKTDLICVQFSKLLMWKMFSSAPPFLKFLHNQKYYLKNHKTMGETTH